MPKGYHHMTHDLRCQIYALKKNGLSQNKIAKEIGVSLVNSIINKIFLCKESKEVFIIASKLQMINKKKD